MFKCGLINGWQPFACRDKCYVLAGALDRQTDGSEIRLYGYDAPPHSQGEKSNKDLTVKSSPPPPKSIARYSIPDQGDLEELVLHRAGDAFVAIGAPEKGGKTCNVRVTSEGGKTLARSLRLGDEVGPWRQGHLLVMCPFKGRVCIVAGGAFNVVDLVT